MADSQTISALLATLPLLMIFILLGIFRVKTHWAALAAMLVAVLVAIVGYGMPVDLAFLSATEGAAFGLFPIMWIVFGAIWVYQLTVVSGRFDDLRRMFSLISDDPRIQALVIAFCFGALLEALAGFGAPVAITGIMLVGLGFTPLRAAVTVLVANTAPVAFGAIATPIITGAALTRTDVGELGAYVGRQTSFVAVVVPLVLLLLVDGRRGLRQAWPAALVCGVTFGLAQFVASNYISVELTDILASLFAMAATVAFLQVWKPRGGDITRAGMRDETTRGRNTRLTPDTRTPGGAPVATLTATEERLSRGRMTMALLPYLLILAVFSVAKLWEPAGELLAVANLKIGWPGLDGQVLTVGGTPNGTTVFSLGLLSSPGTILILVGIVVAMMYRITPSVALAEFRGMALKLRWACLTVASVLALAYVMNLSGETVVLAAWIAGTGAALAFFSPVLGWLGTAVTGSDTSANALFATMQHSAAAKAGLDPTLLVAANTSGGVVGKMISPQNLIIAAAAVSLPGYEDRLLRRTLGWSVGLLLMLCVLVYLQSTVLAWMLP